MRCSPSSTRGRPTPRQYIRAQHQYADIVVAFAMNNAQDPAHLDADLILRDTLPHPDLSPLIDGSGLALIKREREWLLRIPGNLDPDHAAELEEAVWQRHELREPPAHPAARRVHGGHGPAAAPIRSRSCSS